MKVTEIWRYPVKTMAGEMLQRVTVGPLGVEGDRIVHVEDARGRVITSCSHPRFLSHKGTLGADGEPLVDGRPWNDPEVAAQIREIGGLDARLVRFDGAERFDVLPLLVATDGAIAAFGHDRRRLRPNIVIGGGCGYDRTRVARQLPAHRQGCHWGPRFAPGCIMTSYDPDTQIQDKEITRGIYRRFKGKLALNCFVIEGGEIAVGDDVQLVRGRACAKSAATAIVDESSNPTPDSRP